MNVEDRRYQDALLPVPFGDLAVGECFTQAGPQWVFLKTGSGQAMYVVGGEGYTKLAFAARSNVWPVASKLVLLPRVEAQGIRAAFEAGTTWPDTKPVPCPICGREPMREAEGLVCRGFGPRALRATHTLLAAEDTYAQSLRAWNGAFRPGSVAEANPAMPRVVRLTHFGFTQHEEAVTPPVAVTILWRGNQVRYAKGDGE